MEISKLNNFIYYIGNESAFLDKYDFKSFQILNYIVILVENMDNNPENSNYQTNLLIEEIKQNHPSDSVLVHRSSLLTLDTLMVVGSKAKFYEYDSSKSLEENLVMKFSDVIVLSAFAKHTVNGKRLHEYIHDLFSITDKHKIYNETIQIVNNTFRKNFGPKNNWDYEIPTAMLNDNGIDIDAFSTVVKNHIDDFKQTIK